MSGLGCFGLPLDTDDRMLYDGDYNDVGLLLILKGSVEASPAVGG